MKLAEKSNEVFEEINEVKKLYIREFIDEDELKSMDHQEFELVQKMLKIIDLSMDLVHEEMKAIDEIDSKLDKLLEKKKD